MMYYGVMGLVNYVDAERPLTEVDIIDYEYYSVEDRKLSDVIKAHKKCLFAVYSSMWRMVAKPVMGIKYPSISQFDLPRRVEAIYINDLFPMLFEDKAVYKTYLDKIYEKTKDDWKRLGTLTRNSGVRLVIAVPPN